MRHTNHTDAATRTGQPSAGAARRAASSWRIALAGLVLIPVILACTTTVRLDKAPASSLILYLTFEHALVPGSTTEVRVGIFASNPHNIVEGFTGGQTLTIDGVKIEPGHSAIIPRQTAAEPGVYTVTYTDEHGAKTVAQIPAPRADLAFVQPTAGSRVELPKPVTGATPSPSDNPYQRRPPLVAHTPLTVRYTLPYLPDYLALNTKSDYQVDVGVIAPCAPAWPKCQPLHVQQNVSQISPDSGAATIDDSIWEWGVGFETRAPGPGQLTMDIAAQWRVSGSGFMGLDVDFENNKVSAPITWV